MDETTRIVIIVVITVIIMAFGAAIRYFMNKKRS